MSRLPLRGSDARGLSVLLLLVIGIELAAVLALNEGHLIYALDDPYIHLALAEEVGRGHYGVNPGEASSPSSSAVWPLLLSPLARTPLGPYAPLLLNVVFAIAAALAFERVAALALDESGRWVIVGAVAFVAVSANLIGLVFQGMEHVAQVGLAAALTLGLIREARGEGVPWWLVGVLVAGPLVRYENLALSVPALAYLAIRGHRRAAAAGGALLAVGLGGFALFLHSLGLPPFPASVVSKSVPVAGGGQFGAIAANLDRNLIDPRGRLLALAGVAYALVALSRGRPAGERALAVWGGAAAALHLIVGDIGWFERYEAYVWASSLLLLLYLFRGPLLAVGRVAPGWRAVALAGLLAFALGREVVINPFQVPLATNDIYSQQYQMHRFAAEYWRAPVAVNDLGWVAFRNDHYVLDLRGLASMEAQAARARGGTAWMEALAGAHGVGLAMIYDEWFEGVPPSWIRLGTLAFHRGRVVAAQNRVAFYARGPDAAARATRLLRSFARTLPPGSSFTFERPSAEAR